MRDTKIGVVNVGIDLYLCAKFHNKFYHMVDSRAKEEEEEEMEEEEERQ